MRAAANPGDVIDDRYEVVRMIGRGAMADVFEARDAQAPDALVALKILRAAVAKDPEAVQRFEHEVRVQEMIAHRNVARLFGAGVWDASPYLVMELLRGRSLLDVLKAEGAVGVVRAASYAWQALQGLHATHAVGVLHRDLKPANLMLEPSPGPVERVVLIDFGFASLGAATGLTMQGTVVGTLSYMAPERLTGGAVDVRADVYGVGCILYELLVGRAPFASEDDMEIMRGHIERMPEPPSRANPAASIPPELDEVVMRALAKHPDDRPADAAAMALELQLAAQRADARTAGV